MSRSLSGAQTREPLAHQGYETTAHKFVGWV